MDKSLAGDEDDDDGVAPVRPGSAEVRGSCLILHKIDDPRLTATGAV